MLISRQDEIFSALNPDDYIPTNAVEDACEGPQSTQSGFTTWRILYNYNDVLLVSSSETSINQICVFPASQQCQIFRTDQL